MSRNLISDQLRDILRAEKRSLYALAEEAGINRGNLTRFLTGAQALSGPSIDRLAEALGVKLIQTRRRPAK